MSRLKFVLTRSSPPHSGYESKFTDGTGYTTTSWWGSPSDSIDHADKQYISDRHPNAVRKSHFDFIKAQYKNEMIRINEEKESADFNPYEMSDIDFLIHLQKELNIQETDIQASPRYWAVGDYRWVECIPDNAESFYVYLPSAAESYLIEDYLKMEEEDSEIQGEALEEFKEIDEDYDLALEWIHKYRDEGAHLIPSRKEHFVKEGTFFLTKAEAKRHIQQNHYHYTSEVHTYAMTAFRAPKFERLLKVLSEFDFASLADKGEKQV